MLRRTCGLLATDAAPPSLVVLSMTLNGGALTPALSTLGYHPYTFETTFRYGHVTNHPREWLAVLQHNKPFDPILLQRPTSSSSSSSAQPVAKTAADTPSADSTDATPAAAAAAAAAQSSRAAGDWTQYDALVGPPATLAFEAILKACPLSTKVILVEEPDKVAWEKQMDLILEQVRRETRRLRMIGSARQLGEMVDAMVDIRRALGHRRERSARQQKVLAGRPLHNLSQGAALSLFEDHVKEVVPRDRLLVYRLGDGWEPLCRFLDTPLPVDSETPGAASSATSTTPSPSSSSPVPSSSSTRLVPFPANTDGLEVFSTLSSATQSSGRIMTVLILCVVGFSLVFLTPFVARLRALYVQEQAQYKDTVQPYLEEGRRTGDVSVRRMMIMSKKSTIESQKQYHEEGGFGEQWRNAWRDLLGAASKETPQK